MTQVRSTPVPSADVTKRDPVSIQPLMGLRRTAAAGVVIGWIALILVGAVWFALDDDGLWFLSGAVACLVVSLPFVVGPVYDLISPWTLVVVAVYLGYGLRGVFIGLDVEGTRSLESLYFLGNDPDYFFAPTLLVLLGVLSLTAGYLIAARRRPGQRPSLTARRHLAPHRIQLAVLVSAVLGLLGFVLFVRSTGGFSLTSLSAKRTLIGSVDLQSTYQSFGEYRVLNSFAPVALFLQVAWYNYRKLPHGPTTPRFYWLALLFINAALLPFYASTRADVVYIIAGVMVIRYCLGGARFRVGLAVGAITAVAVLTAAMSSLRQGDDESLSGIRVDSRVVVDTFVLTRTFGDLPTAGNIIEAVPERLPYARGETIMAWAVAPIPRAIWPTKPLVSSGPILGTTVFGTPRSGVPPGAIAESYWNFGVGGLMILPLLCGAFLRLLSDRWAPYARSSPSAAIVMAAVVITPGMRLMANSIGAAPYQVVQTLVVLLPVLLLASSSTDPGQQGGVNAGGRRSGSRPARR